MAERILVPFAAEGSGIGELTWGQQQIWQAMRATNSSQSIGGVVPVPAGKTVTDLAAELLFFMTRYESMRTRLRFDDDGEPSQVVSSCGEIALEVHDAGEAEDPAEVAADLAERWEARAFDYANEWPIRMAVVRQGGIATHVVVTVCHLAADGAATAVMAEELAVRDLETDAVDTPPAMTPRELAAQQRTPAAQRQSDAALRYWERLLRTIPDRPFGDRPERLEPRYRQAEFQSSAMLLATRSIAERLRTDSGSVLLAAFAVALARLATGNPVAVQAIVSNRFRPGLSHVISPVNENGLYLIDVAGITFDEAVTRAQRAVISGSKHAYYDPIALDALIARIGHERGMDIDLGCVLNDRRLGNRETTETPTPEQIRAALPTTTLCWTKPLELFNEKLMVSVNDAADVVDLLVEVDTHHLSVAGTEALLYAMETIVVTAAFDPATPTGIAALDDRADLPVR